MAKVTGPCHICNTVGDLSFEHVPPRAAFNDRPVENPDIRKLIGRTDPGVLDNPRGRTSQRGAGAYTLCPRCNSITGHRYGTAYVDWAIQGLGLINASGGSPSLYHVFHIFPLRVLKQVVTMFFSANGPNFRATHPGLVRFVLNRDERHLDPGIRVFAFYTLSNRSRQSGVSTLLRLSDDGLSAQAKFFSEITFPPFGYVLSINSPPPDGELFDISFFAGYRYQDWVDVQLRLRAKPIFSWLPGDYRTREEVEETFRANLATLRRA